MKILDAGCGMHKYKGQVGDVVIGVDFINNKYADVTHDLNKFPYPFKANEFDMVWCRHVLEHLNDPIKAVEEFWRITKPGGRVVITVPHCSSIVAWSDIGHKQAYNSRSMNPFDINRKDDFVSSSQAKFKVQSHIHWQSSLTFAKHNAIAALAIIATAIVDWLANQNFYTKLLTERFLCFYLGGFEEVRFYLEVVK